MRIVRALLDAGVDVNTKNRRGETAIRHATDRGDTAVLELLLRAAPSGACDVGDDEGDTPLHAACWGSRVGAVRCLLKHGADTDVRNGAGATPLHTAAAHGAVDAIAALVRAGADVCAKDKRQATALHLAAQEGCDGAVTMLLALGGEAVQDCCSSMDADCMTPADCAKTRGHDGIAAVLTTGCRTTMPRKLYIATWAACSITEAGRAGSPVTPGDAPRALRHTLVRLPVSALLRAMSML